MSYEQSLSSMNPRLLILLTDELEESVRVVNRLIEQQIQLNFDGNAPKNRCFITVVGYNNGIKALVSGWLRDLDVVPLRLESYNKKVSDGAGGTIEVNCLHPIWVDSVRSKAFSNLYADSIRLAIDICKGWSRDYEMAPIVIDCSDVCHTNYALNEIEQLKNILTKDGATLFWCCYPDNQITDKYLFSEMPQEWRYSFRRSGFNESKLWNGCYDRRSIFSVMAVITDMAEEPVI